MAPAKSLLSALEGCEFTSPSWGNRSSQLKSRNSKCRNGLVVRGKARFERRRAAPPRSAMERKVRTLKKLVPNCESMGVERLFRETAEYIVALQMRVKVMQSVVDALVTACDDDDGGDE